MRLTTLRSAVLTLVWVASASGGVRTDHSDGRPASEFPLYGLPKARVYGPGSPEYTENAASSLCLACHTASPVRNVNPDAPLFPSSYVSAGVRAGSHFVIHYDAAVVRLSCVVEAVRPLRTVAWASGGRSKYAKPAPPDVNAKSVNNLLDPASWDQRGDVTCESCHSLIRNVAGGNNLLAEHLESADSSLLCEGCHTAEAGGPPGHHPLDLVQPRGIKTPPAGSEITLPSNVSKVNCASCHMPHGAQTHAGARCLKRGFSAVPTVSGRPVNVIYYADRPDPGDVIGQIKVRSTADGVPGVDRQCDLGVPRVVSNGDALCDSCHTQGD